MIKIISFFISTSIILAVNCIKAQHQNHRLLFYHLEKNGTFTLISDTTKKYDNETEFKISKEEHIDIYFSYRGSEFIKASYTGEMAKLKLESGKVKIPHGLGRLNANNFSYDGLWHLGNFQGDGNLKWESNTYTGSFNKSYFNGPGNFTSATETYNGNWLNDKRHGNGLLTTSEYTYDGDFYENQKHGKGTVKYLKTSEEYTGNWLNDKRHGKGLLTTSEYTYDGDFYENQKHGKGTVKYLKTSEEYTGDWLNDKRHGEGSMDYNNLTRYSGAWVNDKRHGAGTLDFPKGFELVICEYGAVEALKLITFWQNDSIFGVGELTYKSTSMIDSNDTIILGNKSNDPIFWNGFRLSGIISRVVFKNGNEYDGEIKNGKLDGKGNLIFNVIGTIERGYKKGVWENGLFTGKAFLPMAPNGYFKGNLIKDLKHGEGEYKYTDGTIYHGNWENDIRMGKGKYTWPNGNNYEGEWKNNQINGTGILTLKSNSTWKCNWKDWIPCDSGEVRCLNGAQYNGGVSGKKEGNIIRYFYQGYGQFYQKFATEDSSMINDSSYVGFFNEGLPHGNGRLERNLNNEGNLLQLIYDGEWNNGLRDGTGEEINTERTPYFFSSNVFTGEWKNNLKNGKGNEYEETNFYNGTSNTKSSKTGVWLNNILNTNIDYSTTYSSYESDEDWENRENSKYVYYDEECVFTNNKLQCKSKTSIFDKNGHFEGDVKENTKNGFGKMEYKNGAIYEGEWKNDLPNGQGTMILTNKKIQKGIFSNGKFIRSN